MKVFMSRFDLKFMRFLIFVANMSYFVSVDFMRNIKNHYVVECWKNATRRFQLCCNVRACEHCAAINVIDAFLWCFVTTTIQSSYIHTHTAYMHATVCMPRNRTKTNNLLSKRQRLRVRQMN